MVLTGQLIGSIGNSEQTHHFGTDADVKPADREVIVAGRRLADSSSTPLLVASRGHDDG